MPLLYPHYEDLESNQLNKAKKRIFSSAVSQYTQIGSIQSNIQPTLSQMNQSFLKITTFLMQIQQQLVAVINGGDANKVALEFGPLASEFANEFNLKIYPFYNYFNPQQNQQISTLMQKLQDTIDNILFGNQLYGQVIDNFLENFNEQINLLTQSIDNYSPLKITLRKGRNLITNDDGELQGGYIAGGSRNKGQKYPEIRFR
jgi:hypothetical protein